MKTKVLMVCLGNICRSPLAEGILKSKVDLSKVEVSSAGTAHYHIGELPDKRSIETAKRYGIDITDQRGKQFTPQDFDKYDYIFVMDQSNYQNVINLARDEKDKQKVSLILAKISKGEIIEVPDPYYGGDQGFDNVYHMLDQATDIIAKEIS